MKILLVEDERYIAEAVEQVLKKNNYSVDLAFDGEYGLDCALSGIYDIVVLDIMLPKKDGVAVLREMRKSGVKTPVLLLTAKSRIEDKVTGLDAGADDYLAKPFHYDELLARLRALGRRQEELFPDGILAFKGIELNPNTLMLTSAKGDTKLTPKESQILELLIRSKEMTISKETIIEKLWGYETDAEDSHVEIHMSNLRKKLKQVNADCSVYTIRNVGYVLKG
ncbi:MAG: response regulator transcription factor [Oscillospiraceae bacterium]|jgi:DNA-binding response OmpR family regulator|nr:response regulator transcription factor [Oscillospiraceae bacterium]